MSFSQVVRRGAVVLVLVVPGVAFAQASGPGGGQPPKTKKQCLAILKADRHEWAAERKSYPARKQAAKDKIASRRSHVTALVAQRRAISQQIDAVMNTSTEGLTQDQVDAMNAQIDALLEQKRELQDKIDVAGGKADEAVFAYKAVVAKYRDDAKN